VHAKGEQGNGKCNGNKVNKNSFDCLKREFPYVRKIILEMVYQLSSYNIDTIYWEISPRNVRVAKGKLLFLDCFSLASS